jgi:RNA polymerase sigma factor (sigma-70 family)
MHWRRAGGIGLVTRSFNTSNPLESTSAHVWDELIEAIGPASLLVVIEQRMGSKLRRRYGADDVFQEAMLHAWRDRARCEWRGVRAFRSWVLTIIDHRIRDLADREIAQKRGGSHGEIAASELHAGMLPQGMVTTSPSKVAIYREQALAMREALGSLDEEVREVVRLRLFEQRAVAEVAESLGIGESAVRHRFRRGAEMYHARLKVALAGSSTRGRVENADDQHEDDASPREM